MKSIISILLLALSFSAFSQQVGQRTNTQAATNKSWQVYRALTPTNAYGSSQVVMEVNYDSTYLHSPFVKIDVLDNRASISPSKKYVSADTSGIISQKNFDDLTFTASQITGLSTVATSGAYSDLSGTPSLAPYMKYTDTVSLSNRINAKLSPSDTISLSNRIDAIALKRVEGYSGTTNSSGVYTVTYSTALSTAPVVSATIIGGSDTQLVRVTSSTTTGFSVLVRNRVDVIGLLPSYTNANGATVNITVVER